MLHTYGHEVVSVEDPWVRVAEKGVLTIEAAGAVGAHIVDFIPWCNYPFTRYFARRLIDSVRAVRHIPDWCPGARNKALPPGTRENLQNFVNKPFEHVKKEMVRESSTC